MQGGLLRMLRLFFRLHVVRLRVQVEYEADFWLGIFGVLLMAATNFLFLWVLFRQVPTIAGWTLWEAAFLYALLIIPRGLVDLFCDGAWQTPYNVHSGTFDRALVRPFPLLLQVFSWSSKLHGVGNFLLGGWLLVSATRHLHLEWTALRVAILVGTFCNSLMIVGSLVVAANATVFWTRSPSNAFAVFITILSDAVQVPITVYGRGLKILLTWILPFAFVSHYPACVLLGKPIEPSWMAWVLPLTGPATALVSYAIWRAGVARYESAGG